jgi:hypothetical protein
MANEVPITGEFLTDKAGLKDLKKAAHHKPLPNRYDRVSLLVYSPLFDIL